MVYKPGRWSKFIILKSIIYLDVSSYFHICCSCTCYLVFEVVCDSMALKLTFSIFYNWPGNIFVGIKMTSYCTKSYYFWQNGPYDKKYFWKLECTYNNYYFQNKIKGWSLPQTKIQNQITQFLKIQKWTQGEETHVPISEYVGSISFVYNI